MSGNESMLAKLPEGVTFAARYKRIEEACRTAKIDILCRAHAWATGETPENMEQLVYERLWNLWRDEWDATDHPYGGETDESAWTVPKFCHNVAAKVIRETERDYRIKGVTQSPSRAAGNQGSSLFVVDTANVQDLDQLYRADGSQAFILLLLPDTIDNRRLVEARIADQIDPDHDPDRVYAGAERAAQAIWRQLTARAGGVEAARMLDRIESGRDPGLADRMRTILFRVYYGDAAGLHELVDGINPAPRRTRANKPVKPRRRARRRAKERI